MTIKNNNKINIRIIMSNKKNMLYCGKTLYRASKKWGHKTKENGFLCTIYSILYNCYPLTSKQTLHHKLLSGNFVAQQIISIYTYFANFKGLKNLGLFVLKYLYIILHPPRGKYPIVLIWSLICKIKKVI